MDPDGPKSVQANGPDMVQTVVTDPSMPVMIAQGFRAQMPRLSSFAFGARTDQDRAAGQVAPPAGDHRQVIPSSIPDYIQIAK